MQADSLPAEPQKKPKNTGVGSLSLLQGLFPTQELNLPLLNWKADSLPLNHQGSPCVSRSVMSNSLQSLCSPPGSSVQGDCLGKNTGVGCHALLQGFFPTQRSNLGLPHCRWILYYLSHQGSPRILEWVAYPFSRGSSQPRNRTGVSCIAGRFFTS